MRSTVDLVAESSRTGHTRVSRMYHDGAITARITGTGAIATVHLVGSAAGPMSGDVIDITLTVGPAARVRLRSVAAALVLPGPRSGEAPTPAEVTIRIDVAEGAEVDVELQPTIVTTRGWLSQSTTVTLHPSATLRLREHVVGGRYDEAGGAWATRLDVHRGERPVLRQLMSDHTSPARVLIAGLDLWPGGADEPPHPHAWGGAACGSVVCRLAAGGWAATAWGPDLTSTCWAMSRLAPAKSHSHAPQLSTVHT